MSTTFSTEADARQHVEVSARNINKILSDAATGDVPLVSNAVVTEASVTPNFEDLTAGQSQVIPVGAKGWSATILTGTGTINGKAAPAGFSISDNNTLLATVTVTMDTPGSAFVAWNT